MFLHVGISQDHLEDWNESFDLSILSHFSWREHSFSFSEKDENPHARCSVHLLIHICIPFAENSDIASSLHLPTVLHLTDKDKIVSKTHYSMGNFYKAKFSETFSV